MHEPHGHVGIFLLKIRAVAFPDFDSAIGTALFIEPAPPSRHISVRPGHRHRVINTFRQVTGTPSPFCQCMSHGTTRQESKVVCCMRCVSGLLFCSDMNVCCLVWSLQGGSPWDPVEKSKAQGEHIEAVFKTETAYGRRRTD